MSEKLINIQKIEVKQIYGILRVKELPIENWYEVEEETWNEDKQSIENS